MLITEPIGSIPRPLALVSAAAARDRGELTDLDLEPIYTAATLKAGRTCIGPCAKFAPWAPRQASC